jgi:hypothetical protein
MRSLDHALAAVRHWRRDAGLAVVDLAVTLGVLAAALATHHRWLGALAGIWLVLTLRQVWLAVRARRASRSSRDR